MKNNFNNDVDNENLNIAKQILEDSANLNTDNVFDENILNNIKNSKRTKMPVRKLYTFTSVAACILLIIGSVFFAKHNLTPIETSIGKTDNLSSQTKMADNNSISSKTTHDYKYIYNRMTSSVNNTAYNSADRVFNDSSNSAIALSESSKQNYTAKNNIDFYNTNEQTQNVHEGDIVKTDGNYIYTLNYLQKLKKKNGKSYTHRIVITKADGMNLKTISEIPLPKNETISEFYIYENKLTAISSKYKQTQNINAKISTPSSIMYDYAYGDGAWETHIYTYDISNKNQPKLLSKNKQDGHYNSSRMNNGFLYTISYIYMNITDIDNCVPKVNGKLIHCENVYLPAHIENSAYTIITTLNINESENFFDSVATAGGASTIYASEDNLYLINNTTDEKDISNTVAGKKALKNTDMKIYKHKKVKVRKYMKNHIKNTYKNVDYKHLSAYKETRAYKSSQNINIIKYSYNNGKVMFIAETDADGYSYDNLNFDEKDGYLRFVTTERYDITLETRINYYDKKGTLLFYDIYDSWSIDSSKDTNNVFVLDDNLNLKAEINNIANGESIYSARFLGDYGYFVTYENKDPLFSVDFSDLENPKIIGKLELPGFSSYLHFYSESSLFGLGVETDEETGNNECLKMEMYNLKSGKAHTESKLLLKKFDYAPALYDYKSIMVDAKRNLIGFSAVNYDTSSEDCTSYILYTYKNQQFDKLLEIKLKNAGEETRSFYIGDYLYIVQPYYGIKVLNLKTYSTDKKVELEKFS